MPHKRLPGLNKKDGFLPHPFDEENQVRTSGLVVGRHLKTGSAQDRHTTAYYGIAPSVFHALVKRWRKIRPAAPLEETTFLDIGAGMGRAVLLAAEMPFKRVIGIEMHPTLARIARQNVAIWRKSGPGQPARIRAASAKIVEADATQFPFPSGPCVAFLFNPFAAPAMRRFLRHINQNFADRKESESAPLDLLYANNEQEHILQQQRNWVCYFQAPVYRSRKDAKADYAIMANQPEGEYASADYEDCSIWRRTSKFPLS